MQLLDGLSVKLRELLQTPVFFEIQHVVTAALPDDWVTAVQFIRADKNQLTGLEGIVFILISDQRIATDNCADRQTRMAVQLIGAIAVLSAAQFDMWQLRVQPKGLFDMTRL